jgi:hypothetical protein
VTIHLANATREGVAFHQMGLNGEPVDLDTARAIVYAKEVYA